MIRFVPALAATVLCACSGPKADRKPPAPEAGYAVVQPTTVAIPTTLAGRTAAFEASEVRPQVTGIIQARLFTEGALVRAGQTLYRIDPSVYRAAQAQAQASVAAAEAARGAAAARADRFKPLAAIEAISQQDYTDAAAAARQAAATVAVNRAALAAARVNLRFTTVPAPITGRIGRSLVTTGALVTANQVDALTTIQRLDPMLVDIAQSSADLLALRRSLSTGNAVASQTSVRITLEDGSVYPYAGTLQFTEGVTDPATGTVTLRARFPNPQGLLLPGMYVRATLSQAAITNAMLVPQAGVSRDPRGNATVLIVGPGNKALRRTITTTRALGANWVVTSGLKPGDRVIVEGLVRVKADKPVVPVPAGSKPRAPERTAGSGGARP